VDVLHDRPADWDGHLLLLHRGEAHRRSSVAAWVRRGLERGEKVLYTEPPDEPAHRTLSAVLGQHGVDADEALHRGQVQVVAASETAYDPAWQLGVVEAALAEGYPSVRWAGEAETAWTVMTRCAHAQVERSTDDLCRTRPLSVLCQYPVQESEQDLTELCSVHGAGVREGIMTVSCTPDGIAVAGEVDISNRAILRSALVASTASGGDAYTLDLHHLQFLDVSGTRAIVSGTAGYRSHGGRVLIRAAQRPVERLLHVLELDQGGDISMEGA
jgi:anti-anti-sigma factor